MIKISCVCIKFVGLGGTGERKSAHQSHLVILHSQPTGTCTPHHHGDAFEAPMPYLPATVWLREYRL